MFSSCTVNLFLFSESNIILFWQDIPSKHVYLTPRALDGGASSHSLDESNNVSPQTHHVYAIGSSRSVRETDSDTNTNSPKQHVYAFQ